jgi:hypothetical protein
MNLSITNEKVSSAVANLASAEAEVRRLARLQEEKTVKETNLLAELKQVEAGKDANIPNLVGAEVSAQRIQLELVRTILEALKSRIASAKKLVISSKALVLQCDADRLEQEAIRRQEITDKLLNALEDFEDCAYVPALYAERSEKTGGNTCGDPQAQKNVLPLTFMLMERAMGLRANATALEQGQPMPWNVSTGQLITPFEIDFEAGAVRIPELVIPVMHDPLTNPYRYCFLLF